MKTKFSTVDLAIMGLLTALTVIASRYLKIEIGTMIRLNFSSSFIMLSGIWLGPIAGALVGGVSDLLGCLVGGYAINPLYTLMPIMVGVFSALCEPIFRKYSNVIVYGLVILAITFVASSLYGTWALSMYYGTPFIAYFWSRLVQGLLSTVMNTAVIYMLYRSPVTGMLHGQRSRAV